MQFCIWTIAKFDIISCRTYNFHKYIIRNFALLNMNWNFMIHITKVVCLQCVKILDDIFTRSHYHDNKCFSSHTIINYHSYQKAAYGIWVNKAQSSFNSYMSSNLKKHQKVKRGVITHINPKITLQAFRFVLHILSRILFT